MRTLSTPSQLLNESLAKVGVSLTADQVDHLQSYSYLLMHWNKRFNLIGRSTEADLVERHLADSLSILPHLFQAPLPTARCLDVGSGAGLPGIPLAIAAPDTEFVLLDSNGKKTRFITQAVAELQLDNVSVRHTRVEDYQEATRFDRIISRAWTSLAQGLASVAHLCRPDGRIGFMKGANHRQELRDVPKPFTLARCIALPNINGQRYFIEFRLSPG